MKTKWAIALILLIPIGLAAQQKGKVLEEIVARVNNEVITKSDLDRALASIRDEARQDCPACTPDQLQTRIADKDKNALRDLIDQSLLVQRAKDLGISVETDVVKRLDQIRQQNTLPSMEELEKKVNESGINYEDFKDNIRKQLLVQEVIRREVGSKIIVDRTEIQKYYEEHKQEFVRPEMVYLAEIFVSTENKPAADIPSLKQKAEGLLDRVRKGDDFGELAKRFSDGSTAKGGGELGAFERGQLSKQLEDLVFKMERNQVTDVIQTKTGYLILKVLEHYQAGLQPLSKVEQEITNRLYMQKMEPALRDYLKTLREDSYVVVKPGFVDTAAAAGAPIQEVAPQPDAKKKQGGHKFLFFGHKKEKAGE